MNTQGGEHGNALHAASLRGHVEIVRLLLDKGADVNAQGGDLGNALYVASDGGHAEIVRLLLDKGVDVNVQGGEYIYMAMHCKLHHMKVMLKFPGFSWTKVQM